MPPYAQRRQPKLTEVQTILRKYDISKKGFLPARTPLDRLPDPLYRPWEDILPQLPDLLERGELHRSVEKLDILSTQGLRTEDQWRRAYVVLSFLAHAYIWGGEKASEVRAHNIDHNYSNSNRPRFSRQQSRCHISKFRTI